jgi:hypothetical protein
MMAMLAQLCDYVIGGDPDRDTIDLAVLDAVTGAVRGHASDSADGPRLCQAAEMGARTRPGQARLGARGHRQLRRRAGSRPG